MIHSCVEAYIVDTSHTDVTIKQQDCCCTPTLRDTVCEPDINIIENANSTYRIIDVSSGAYICVEAVGGADIIMDWVCGVDYSVNYLHVTPTETVWISIDYSVDYDIRSNTDWIVQ